MYLVCSRISISNIPKPPVSFLGRLPPLHHCRIAALLPTPTTPAPPSPAELNSERPMSDGGLPLCIMLQQEMHHTQSRCVYHRAQQCARPCGLVKKEIEGSLQTGPIQGLPAIRDIIRCNHCTAREFHIGKRDIKGLWTDRVDQCPQRREAKRGPRQNPSYVRWHAWMSK